MVEGLMVGVGMFGVDVLGGNTLVIRFRRFRGLPWKPEYLIPQWLKTRKLVHLILRQGCDDDHVNHSTQSSN